MSLELRNVEKKIGQETHIYETNLKLNKKKPLNKGACEFKNFKLNR